MPKVTLQSIADAVGVSRMTVSNAFSRPDQLSAELRERILAAAAELGYVGPDPAARALARGRTGSVGLLLYGSVREVFSDLVAADLIASVADALSEHGLALTLLTPPHSDDFQPARDVAVDGALIYSCNPASTGIAWLDRRRVPMVTIDSIPHRDAPHVNIDDRAGARAAAQHLIDLGHTRIAMISLQDDERRGPAEDLSTMSPSHPAHERVAGWREAIEAAGLEPVVRVAPDHSETGIADVARGILETTDVTAILCFSDVFAAAVLRAAESLGRSVPDDLSVVGFDDSPLAQMTRPPLTTVHQDVAVKGRSAVEALVDVLAGRSPESVRLPTSLVVRGSTAPPPD
jgi:DNA-binding LacI/PurR family transcriptional regulator